MAFLGFSWFPKVLNEYHKGSKQEIITALDAKNWEGELCIPVGFAKVGPVGLDYVALIMGI